MTNVKWKLVIITAFKSGESPMKLTTPILCARQRRVKVLLCYGDVFFYGVGTLTSAKGNINAEKYIEVLENKLCPVIVRLFPHGNYVV